MNRRDFLRSALRFVLFGGLAALGAVLARRSCEGRGACSSCAVHPNCSLPWKEARR